MTQRLVATWLVVLLGLTCLLVMAPTVNSQDLDFEQFKKQEQQAFSDFKIAEDRAFVEFLEDEWQAFQVFQGNVRDLKPKPSIVPFVRNSIYQVQPEVATVNYQKWPTEIPEFDGFYGYAIDELQAPEVSLPGLNKLTNKRLADTWSAFSGADHSSLVLELNKIISKLELGDWGKIKLVQAVSESLVTTANQRIAYSWFLLNRLGLDVRVGYSEQTLFLLVPSSTKVYARRYIEIDNHQFYMYPEVDTGDLYSYDYKHNPQLVRADFTLMRTLAASPVRGNIEASSPALFNGQAVSFDYDLRLKSFLQDHPQIDLQWYFQAPSKPPLSGSMQNTVKPLIAGLSERESINELLLLTQFLFQYQTDDQQFGYEKYLLPEESLHYGINDCEDRSVFLANLITGLLGLDVVVLDYPGHVAIAIATKALPRDDTHSFKGQTYVVADPTYIGATLGMEMESAAKSPPKIFPAGKQNTLVKH